MSLTISSSPSPSVSMGLIEQKKGVKHLVDNSKDMKMLPCELILALPEAERPSLAIHGSIPVIDLSGLNGSIEQRLSTIHAISSACAEWGFFRFFRLPLEEKMRYASEDVMDAVRYGTSLNTTRKHALLHWRDFLRHYGGPVPHSYHLCPDNPSNCRKGVITVSHPSIWCLMQPVKTWRVTIRKILSNGRYKRVEHRAVVNAEKTRISVAVGHGPEMDAIVQLAGPLIKKK